MGQYFNAVVLDQNNSMKTFKREIAMYSHIGAKLLEHAWWDSMFCNCVAEQVRRYGRVIWVGDYYDAENSEIKIDWAERIAWHTDGDMLYPTNFTLDGKYLVNTDALEYIDCDEYRKLSTDSDGECIHPLPILTALGNGMSASDYDGANMDYVGAWAWDRIRISDDPPDNMHKLELFFKE